MLLLEWLEEGLTNGYFGEFTVGAHPSTVAHEFGHMLYLNDHYSYSNPNIICGGYTAKILWRMDTLPRFTRMILMMLLKEIVYPNVNKNYYSVSKLVFCFVWL